MSKKRLIPKLQLCTSSFNKNRLVLVITKQFDRVIEIGDPVSQAKIYQDQAADELAFLNIDKNNKDIDKLASVINAVSQEIFMPLTVGGGVRTLEHFRTLLANGADKVSINSEAVLNPALIELASKKYGAQCVVVSIDFKKTEGGSHLVYIKGGTQKTELNPLAWAVEAERLGAGEIMLTDIDHDGMRNGLNIDMTRAIADAVSVPVITGGGCGLAKHFVDGFLLGRADAVASGSFFAHRDQNFMQTRSQIRNAGVTIRTHT